MIGASLKQLEQRYGPARALGRGPSVFAFAAKGGTIEATLLDGFAGQLRVTWAVAPERAEPLHLLEELSVIPHWIELAATDPRRAEHFPDASPADRVFAAEDGSALGLVEAAPPGAPLVLQLSARNFPRQLKAWRASRPR